MQDGQKIKIILVESQNKAIFDSLNYKVIGDYLCYRHNEDSKIFIKRLNDEQGKTREIDFGHLIKGDDELKRHTTFARIGKYSFLRYTFD